MPAAAQSFRITVALVIFSRQEKFKNLDEPVHSIFERGSYSQPVCKKNLGRATDDKEKERCGLKMMMDFSRSMTIESQIRLTRIDNRQNDNAVARMRVL
jgi:hypothetical protein